MHGKGLRLRLRMITDQEDGALSVQLEDSGGPALDRFASQAQQDSRKKFLPDAPIAQLAQKGSRGTHQICVRTYCACSAASATSVHATLAAKQDTSDEAMSGKLLPEGVWSAREEVLESVIYSKYHDVAISLLIYPNGPPPWNGGDLFAADELELVDTFDRMQLRGATRPCPPSPTKIPSSLAQAPPL